MSENNEKNQLIIYQEEKILENQVDDKAKEISKEIAKAESKNELDSLYDVFKINDTKKNIFRINKLNHLLDKVTDEAMARFENRPGEMSNKEVIDYMNVIQNQIERSKNTVDSIKEINAVQVNNTVNVNINNEVSTLSRESREKIIDAIKNILTSTSNDTIIDIKSEDVQEEDKKNSEN